MQLEIPKMQCLGSLFQVPISYIWMSNDRPFRVYKRMFYKMRN